MPFTHLPPLFSFIIVGCSHKVQLLCPRNVAGPVNVFFSSLTSHSRHNKGVPATDGGWPAGGDLPRSVFPQTSARTNGSCPTALLKVLGGRGKDDSRAPNCDSFLQHTVHRGTYKRTLSFHDVDIASEQSAIVFRDIISCTWHLRKENQRKELIRSLNNLLLAWYNLQLHLRRRQRKL